MKRTQTPCANPLFEKWLEEWKEYAVQKDLPVKYNYEKALTSLRQYPCHLASGTHCLALCHFGPKLCSMLDKKLEQYRAKNNLPPASVKSIEPVHDEALEKMPKFDDRRKKTNQEEKAKKSKKTKKVIDAYFSFHNRDVIISFIF